MNLLLGYEIRDLIINSYEGFIAETSRWSIPYTGVERINYCGGTIFLGNSSVFTHGGAIHRTYTDLPPHNGIFYKMTLSLYGIWEPDQIISIQIGSYSTIFQYTTSNLQQHFKQKHCNSGLDGIDDLKVYGHVLHNGDSVGISLAYSNPSNRLGNFGVRDIKLQFTPVTPPSVIQLYWFSQNLKANSSVLTGTSCDDITGFRNSTGGCEICDPMCEGCFGNLSSNCYSCLNGLYDGTQCISCDSTCQSCHGTLPSQCHSCAPSLYLHNNYCIPCNPPLIQTYIDSSISGRLGYCVSPCEASDFIYPDGSCLSTCETRLVSIINATGKFCLSPCSSGQMLYYISTCILDTDCLYPMDVVFYGSIPICEYICPSGQIKYKPTNRCIPISDCEVPYAIVDYNGFASCELGCANSPPIYTYWNNSCNTFCPSRMTVHSRGDALMCNPPICGVVNCSRCAYNGIENIICPDFYQCDIYLGRFCIPYYDYYLEAMVLKPILNGYILQVEVYPSKNGLPPGVNDTLLFTIDDLTLNEDYQYQITPVGIGLFQIKLQALKILNVTNMLAHFTYSPDNLNLRVTLDLPRTIYIDYGVKKAATTTESSSQLLFVLFLISITGMIMGGGLSALWAALPESQYSYYLIYLNIDYVHQTNVYLQSMSSYDLMAGDNSEIENLEMLAPILKKSLPNKFYFLDYSPDFITNADQVLIQIFIMFAGLIITDFIVRRVRFPRQFFIVQKILDKLLRILKWNGLLRQGLTYTLPLSTAAFIQIYSSIFGNNSSLFPLFSAVVTIIVLLWAMVKMYSLIKATPSDRHGRAIYSKLYGTLWEDLNMKETFSRYYYWLTALRGLVLAYVCVFCDLNPYLQIFIVIFYQAGIFALFVKSYKSVREVFCEGLLNKIMLVEEGLLLLMKVFILVFLFVRESASNNMLVLIGWMIILPGAANQGIQIGYSVYKQIKNRKKLYKLIQSTKNAFKNKKVKKIRRINRIRNVSFDLKSNFQRTIIVQ